ncbi:hypothetical protein BDR04DRAFT_386096 [Suillus decipiens]|nr:hypothetical protein BDR04DRAFT_386096 [Suillus decipiens]
MLASFVTPLWNTSMTTIIIMHGNCRHISEAAKQLCPCCSMVASVQVKGYSHRAVRRVLSSRLSQTVVQKPLKMVVLVYLQYAEEVTPKEQVADNATFLSSLISLHILSLNLDVKAQQSDCEACLHSSFLPCMMQILAINTTARNACITGYLSIAEKSRLDHALDDAFKSIGILPSLMGCINWQGHRPLRQKAVPERDESI